jgi:uncharacterized protein
MKEQFDRKKLRRLAKKYGIVKMSVFGSRARGDAKKNSDLDLLVAFKRTQDLCGLGIIQEEFSKSLGMPVDLLTTIHPFLKSYVEKEKIPIIA